MIRTFSTHKIRKTQELSDGLWDFHTLPSVGEGICKKIIVPGCWENEPGLPGYRGQACYERSFQGGENVRLEFKGVSHTAKVLLDEAVIAEHYNACTPFSTVVKALPEGEHHLKVYVDNSFHEQSALHVPNDYQTYGGITRPVVLEFLPDSYLAGLHITPIFRDNSWYLILEATLVNLADAAFDGSIAFALADKELLRISVHLESQETLCQRTEEILCPDVIAWSPAEPKLYEITAKLLNKQGDTIDDLIDRTGFREIQIAGKEILLNREKIQIRGICRHEDHPHFGCAIPYTAMYEDLALIQDLGANSVRTSHYPNDERFLDLCDELGLLVWEENHARGLSEEAMRNPFFEEQCEACIQEMIEAHYNHPSIYIWGILNECASHTEYGRECYKKQFELIRKMDQTRPCSFASCQFQTDICFDLPDVVSYNIYPLWYHDTPAAEYLAELYNWIQTETGGTGKPFLISETGAGAIYGYRTPSRVKWSEEYQAYALEQQLTAILSQEGCSGVYIWQFCDGRVCDSWFSVRPRTMNNKGVFDEYRRPKLSAEVVKRIFTSKHEDTF